MIRLIINIPRQPVETVVYQQSVVRLGRAADNDYTVACDNVSSHHAQIEQHGTQYLFRDLHSTNGSIVERDDERTVLQGERREVVLQPGDVIYLASLENAITVEAIDENLTEEEDSEFSQTILAEASSVHAADLEDSLGDDSHSLRCVAHLSRRLVSIDDLREMARLTCMTLLQAFPKARRALFLSPKDGGFAVTHVESRATDSDEQNSIVLQSRLLIDRCMAERKGFLFLFEDNQMKAVATMVTPVAHMEADEMHKERVILCSPLFHLNKCFGFIEVEAPVGTAQNPSLTRQDLTLATIMSHMLADRLHDLEAQRERIKLARRATAGYMAATVGHCFKNLLFVPMSLSRMIPICLREGKMDEVEWMLARNTVNIRYLDILSNEFAAASKDPNEGFEACDVGQIVAEVGELLGQIAPEKMQCKVIIPKKLDAFVCHGAALKRLLMNLTLNAVDALFGQNRKEPGVITLKAAVNAKNGHLGLAVEDNGPGIPEPILANLRQIYQRIQSSADAMAELQSIAEQVRSTKDQGYKEHYGLGFLFVCQTIQQHRGAMEISAEENVGTRFFITLPPCERDLSQDPVI